MGKTELRKYMREYYSCMMSGYCKAVRKEPMIINNVIGWTRIAFMDDFLELGHKKGEYFEFVQSVFRDKLKLFRC